MHLCLGRYNQHKGLDDAKELVAGSLGKVSQLSLPEVGYTNMAA